MGGPGRLTRRKRLLRRKRRGRGWAGGRAGDGPLGGNEGGIQRARRQLEKTALNNGMENSATVVGRRGNNEGTVYL